MFAVIDGVPSEPPRAPQEFAIEIPLFSHDHHDRMRVISSFDRMISYQISTLHVNLSRIKVVSRCSAFVRGLENMGDDKKFGAMVDACLRANTAVVETGTPAMIAMTRALLWQLGQEAAQREARAEQEERHSPRAGYARRGRAIGKVGDRA
ncbi:hypothetical protein [Methylobacterium sp. J-090]|uniref:hypothetical protein n=1 Tax=Methylobacterium sp. J-090 TaxID=2836666 RepID=UPI001FB91CE9|nr:hypothetical protein [Methylobacterium sp. J-090]MCJ2083353.1 hypothetical protein [Methylobacterium sp. J-090]